MTPRKGSSDLDKLRAERLEKRFESMADEVRRLRAMADTLEDEADRLGLENKELKEKLSRG